MNVMQHLTILDTVGQTKLIKLKNSIHFNSTILVKMERTNPGGSIKDRPALYLIEETEQSGKLLPGGTIIESSSGNFGISLAMIGAAKNYKVIIIVDPKTTAANLNVLKAYGAEVIVVEELDDQGAYHKTRIAMANKLAKEIPNSFRPDQCFNLLNSEAHYLSTAQELLADAGTQLDYVIVAVSTGGQLGGIAKYFHEKSPKTKIVAVDAKGSTVFGGKSHRYLLPGMGLGWTPSNIQDLSLIEAVYKVSDKDVFAACRMVAQTEGLLLGGSSGACYMVGLSIALEEENEAKNIVIMGADSGERYLNTIYNEAWLLEHGAYGLATFAEVKKNALKLKPHSNKPFITSNYKPDLAKELGAI